MAIDSDIKKILDGKRVLRGKISYSIVLKHIIDEIKLSPNEIFNEASLESIYYKLTKIESLLSQITLDRNYKRVAFKKAINSLYLNNSKSEENAIIITDFLDKVDESTEELKEKVFREIMDVKEKFQVFVQTDLLKPEKTKLVKEIITVFNNFLSEQLKKERQVDTPFWKFFTKTNKRSKTISVGFEVNSELKKFLLENSPKDMVEIEKQRNTLERNILDQDKHLERLNPKPKRESNQE